MDKGAHFYRCDFQVHTPRDIRWTGTVPTSDDDRLAYAAQLVKACRDRGLQGIAITDHHDMAFCEFVRRAAADETGPEGEAIPKGQQLVVFPGMELTLGVPCQALLIFDSDFPADLFSLATTALALTPNPTASPKTAETLRLDNVISLRQLKEKLDEHTYLRNRYIVFPNVTNEGKSSLLRTGLHGKYAEMPWVGGYIDGDYTKLTPGIKTILAGKDKNWGNKRVACFQTSDNRREDHNDLAKASTWVKWARPTSEALRQACLAQESRVSQEPPQLPSVVVTTISVSNSAFLGPLELELNPQYNALIGGRGTGKSTILEYLRWALCDQPPPGIDDDETPNYLARRRRLIDSTLRPLKASVQVRFEVNGVAHVVRRSSEDGSLLLKIANDEMRSCSEEEIRTLLPIEAYSQKQLSDVSVRVDELSRFITAPIRGDLARIDRQASDRAERVRQAYSTRQRQKSLMHAIQRRELEERSLSEQAEALRAGLTGLSEDDRLLLDSGKSFDAADRIVQSHKSRIKSVHDELSLLRSTVQTDLELHEPIGALVEPEILAAIEDQYRLFLQGVSGTLAELINRSALLAEIDTPADSPWNKWSEKLSLFKASYEAAVLRSSAHSDKMRQLKAVEEQIAGHAQETARVREELRLLGAVDAAYQNERQAWLLLLRERDDLLAQQCEALTKGSGGAIKASVRRYAISSEFTNVLKQALSGSRFPTSKLEAIESSITQAANGEEHWLAVLTDLEKLGDLDVEREGSERKPESPALAACGLTSTDMDRIAKSLKPEQWLSLSLTPITSTPVFEYRVREGEYIPFRGASAGQQATALLKTLLNEGGPPLIIDQPEEDLDNPVMLEIVEQVWHAKRKRQLIFSSHNANLVVNGDAELVVWCEYRAASDQSRGMIGGEGAIDVPEVREAIKKIMEGGEAAFNLRREKYGF